MLSVQKQSCVPHGTYRVRYVVYVKQVSPFHVHYRAPGVYNRLRNPVTRYGCWTSFVGVVDVVGSGGDSGGGGGGGGGGWCYCY